MKCGESIVEYSVYGKGTPILLFHGGHSGCQEEFGYTKLAESGYSVVTPSRPGYGRTSPSEDLRQACAHYKLLLDQLALDKVHVIAVSAGGPTGIVFCSMFPDRVTSFTLQSAVTQPWLTPEDKEYKVAKRIFSPEREKRTWSMLAAMNNLLPKLTFKMMASSFSTLSYREILERLDSRSYEMFRAMNNRQRSYSGFFIDMEHTQQDYSKELAGIQSPTLIMHSHNDRLVSLSHPSYAKARIPNSQMCILDSWGHLIWMGKHAAEYDDTLISFLDRYND
ncbi:alpha/beta hydrolase [Paenibacillus sp. YPG26]|uniref:alpha/beta hydrolase n=1 Tax=Paenibacillus sp. YPG26 TaxID=2878915 RepID=UPI00203B237D|nr:alpha/beta hydrolase [Paenibacillus sp. YPG26]USB35167.1 alpha/beta hydrolase [Paenibacillus sp. YPG26]